MASSTFCSSKLFGTTEVKSNGASLAQFDGLRPVENMHLPSPGNKPSGLISTSGIIYISLLILFLNIVGLCFCYFEGNMKWIKINMDAYLLTKTNFIRVLYFLC